MTSAGSVAVARSAFQQTRGGATPTSALHSLRVGPIPTATAKELVERHHYLHQLPGGTKLCFGLFKNNRLLGVMTLGAGSSNAYALVEGATPKDCLTLTRLWISDELPSNSESWFIGVVLRFLKKHTQLKFLVSYADPAQGHLGIIYQASNWIYTGLSQATPLYDIGDGKHYHSRSLSHSFGTHGVEHFRRHGVDVKLVPQTAKHRYLYFLDATYLSRVRVPVLPYPRAGNANIGQRRNEHGQSNPLYQDSIGITFSGTTA